MQFNKHDFKENFELYLGGVFIGVTVITVIINVFTRYVLSFTFHWAEEVSLIGFVWTIFLGAAGAFKHKMLMGVDFLLQVTKGKTRNTIEIASNACIFVIALSMAMMSSSYILSSTKVTPILLISYKYLNVSIILAFVLMTVYALINLIKCIKKIALKEVDVPASETNA